MTASGLRLRLRSTLSGKAPYLISVSSFAVKGACSLLMTYWLANSLSVPDFALWATVFSVGMILSVADFGAGQLVLTGVHERRRNGNPVDGLLSNAVAAMLILSLVLLIAAAVTLQLRDLVDGVRFQLLLVGVMLIRLVFIPFGAILSAYDRYHERKVFEALTYVGAALLVYWAIQRRWDVSQLLLGVNILISAGTGAIAWRTRGIPDAVVSWDAVSGARIRAVLQDSLPYFVNNVSGLAIYGGFIALAALVLEPAQTARLALLHGLIFMQLFQVYELVFRTAQTRLQDDRVMSRLRSLVVVGFLMTSAGTAAFGVLILAGVFKNYSFTATELLAFVAFTFGEILYLLITSRMQMVGALRGQLRSLAIVKSAGFAIALLILSVGTAPPTLLVFCVTLVVYSGGTATWAMLRARAADAASPR